MALIANNLWYTRIGTRQIAQYRSTPQLFKKAVETKPMTFEQYDFHSDMTEQVEMNKLIIQFADQQCVLNEEMMQLLQFSVKNELNQINYLQDLSDENKLNLYDLLGTHKDTLCKVISSDKFAAMETMVSKNILTEITKEYDKKVILAWDKGYDSYSGSWFGKTNGQKKDAYNKFINQFKAHQINSFFNDRKNLSVLEQGQSGKKTKLILDHYRKKK